MLARHNSKQCLGVPYCFPGGSPVRPRTRPAVFRSNIKDTDYIFPNTIQATSESLLGGVFMRILLAGKPSWPGHSVCVCSPRSAKRLIFLKSVGKDRIVRNLCSSNDRSSSRTRLPGIKTAEGSKYNTPYYPVCYQAATFSHSLGATYTVIGDLVTTTFGL